MAKIVSDTNGTGEQDPVVERQINLPFDLWAALDAAIKDNEKRRAEQGHTAMTPVEISESMAIAVASILQARDVPLKHYLEELTVSTAWSN